MRQKKVLYLFLAFIFMGVMIGGCSRREDKEEGKVTISIACSYSPKDVGTQIIDKSIDMFMEENPGIKVKKIWFPREYWTKLMTMIAGGTPPDIFRVGPDYIPPLIRKNVVMSLDDFIGRSNILKLKDFFPQVLWKYKFDEGTKTIGKGSLYGFGTDWSPDRTLFFNKDMFDETGIEYPTESLSWEEFRDVAKKLTVREDRKKQFGCLLNAGDIPLLVYQNAGRMFSEDGKRCLLDSPEAIEALMFLVDLRMKYKVIPSYGELHETDYLQLFQTGKLGMFLAGRYLVPCVEEVVKGRIRWGVAPGIHHKKRVNLVTGPFGWVMSKKTGHPEEAWKLMEYLVAGPCEEELAKAGYNIPVIKKIAYSGLFLSNPSHPEGVNKIFLDEVEYTVPSPLTPYCSTHRWQEILQGELDLAFLEKQNAEEAAINAARKINEIIRENQDMY